ncbi:cyclin-like protein [Gaertneriomyces semiglobifer]|nr:cyclin-like protein [Gaertneriomyces semiglobifer]
MARVPERPRASDADSTRRIQRLFLFRQEMEPRYKLDPRYMYTIQKPRLDAINRRELVEWLLELNRHFNYQSDEVFQLAVNLIDRLCSKLPVPLSVYQALGAACFMIASKSCETFPPTCTELEHLSAGAFSSAMLKHMELFALEALNWDVNAATPIMFLDTFLMLFEFTSYKSWRDNTQLSKTYLNAMQSDYNFIRFRPSVQAAAALMRSMEIVDRDRSQFQRVVGQELNNHLVDPAAILAGLDIPRMVSSNLWRINFCWITKIRQCEIRKCRDLITRTMTSSGFPLCKLPPATGSPASRRGARYEPYSRTPGTRVQHGLATPVEETKQADLALKGPIPLLLVDQPKSSKTASLLREASSPFA